MKFKATLACLALVMVIHTESIAAPGVPKPLAAQIDHLVSLLSDGDAVGYPEAIQFQALNTHPSQEVTLAVFTVEGFGGGNNFRQYLAAFSLEKTTTGQPHYSLIDVMPIGAGGWRSINSLHARLIGETKNGGSIFTIKALENISDDAPNFPSKKVILKFVLENSRLKELK
ncbi:hypothetical protein LG200_04120 [Methylobacillus caricis]|uniref:hypothetical protein n=1 Tax=Methylobacillus caricis TaxID=1971611 RepID=UPI001CFF8C56|nr:hypothetical protein [Methylobacillus caricis]MCB5187190.1 hypothetical protein [Methylobacillus caricis]